MVKLQSQGPLVVQHSFLFFVCEGSERHRVAVDFSECAQAAPNVLMTYTSQLISIIQTRDGSMFVFGLGNIPSSVLGTMHCQGSNLKLSHAQQCALDS